MESLKYRTSDKTEIETNGGAMEYVTNNYLASLLITGNHRGEHAPLIFLTVRYKLVR